MRLPPLNALRAFEAAARHASLRRAAAELQVTPGAVSQQIRKLEDDLGLKLFRRSAGGLGLTEAGSGYLGPVRRGLEAIAEATGRVSRRG